MRVAIAALAILAACDGETLKIAFQISSGPVQACPSSAVPAAPVCGDVPLACDSVLNIRIVRPSNPLETYLPLCAAIPRERKRDLCSIEQVTLPARELPKETLEVQVMIWPRDAVKEDPDTGELDCREIYGQSVSIGFGVHGFPEEVAPAPALGGRAYYQPGDEQTVVTLGCSDLGAVNRPACTGQIELRVGVNEFDAPLTSVTSSSPTALDVAVGEPRYIPSRGEHEWMPIKALDLLPPDPQQPSKAPAWFEAVDTLPVEDTLCVQVIGNRGSNTATLTCGRIDRNDRTLELTGIWLPTFRLEQILAGLVLAEVPPQGLTIGVLLDQQGRPASGYEIRSSPDRPVQYLSSTGQVVPGSATTTSGLFVSQEAPYGADFRAYRGEQAPKASGIGGLVTGKVTIVVLQLDLVASG